MFAGGARICRAWNFAVLGGEYAWADVAESLGRRAATMLETKWIIFAGWSLFGFFLVGIGIGLSWGETAIMAMVASFASASAIRIDRQ